MALDRNSPPKVETFWKWWCRGLGSGLTIFLALGEGIPGPVVPLLIGLFFGPELLAGQLFFNRQDKDRE